MIFHTFRAEEEFADLTNPWEAGYFKRAVDTNKWIFSAPYSTGK